MRKLRFSPRAVQASGLICFGFAVFAAGCGGGGGSVSQVSSTVAGGTNNVGATAAPGTNCATGSGGVAYIPDGGVGTSSLTVIPFENTAGVATSCQVTSLSMPVSIGALAVSPQGTGLALSTDGAKIIGLGGFVSGQMPFTSGNQGVTGGAMALTSIAVVANGTAGFGVSPDTNASTAGFVGLNNLLGRNTVAPPTPTPNPSASATPTAVPTPYVTPTSATVTPLPYPNIVPYTSIGAPAGMTSAALFPSGTKRGAVSLGPDGSSILVRGNDLSTFQLQTTLAGYIFAFPAGTFTATTPITDVSHGTNGGLGFPAVPTTASVNGYGRGLMAFFPSNASAAIIGGTSGASPSSTTVTVISGLPTIINEGPKADVGAAVTSLAVSTNSAFAAVGTSSGIKIVGQLGATPLVVADSANSAVQYRNSAGTSGPIGSVTSIGVSPDSKYVTALVADGDAGHHSSFIVLPIDTNGTLTAPVVTVNNLTLSSSDSMVVR